jgi:hypothetical protein
MIKLLCLLLIFNKLIYADCIFRITNNFYNNITLKVGFYGYESKIVKINKANTNLVTIKNNRYNCTSQSEDGLGVSFGELFESNANGKWIYSPQEQMIVALGKSTMNDNYKYGTLSNHQSIILMNNYKPNSSYFDIIINPTINVNYRTGSHN